MSGLTFNRVREMVMHDLVMMYMGSKVNHPIDSSSMDTFPMRTEGCSSLVLPESTLGRHLDRIRTS